MPVPEFIRELRAQVGHRELWLSGVSVVVLDAGGRVLLTRRVDNGRWAVVSGVLEPGEEPARAAVREVAEETAVTVDIVRLTSVDVTPVITYPNGDRARYLDVCFLAHHVAGDPRAADDENSDVAWFAPDSLPDDLTDTSRLRISKALEGGPQAWFRR
ncbi:NUDIX hydrolase [Gordonia paraffinivorans]|uniref:Nucleoside triphosphatase nudI n=1 Tax=Gordonia paraffinivorans TaxID=175628 RepID=A0ABD7V195_9ACTN|nr:NUDIX domain-containing protein [Gordonia paraffinivorans]VFA87942.1 Nucleoside triphosphatase nudI [Gordonia paraffinivorans]